MGASDGIVLCCRQQQLYNGNQHLFIVSGQHQHHYDIIFRGCKRGVQIRVSYIDGNRNTLIILSYSFPGRPRRVVCLRDFSSTPSAVGRQTQTFALRISESNGDATTKRKTHTHTHRETAGSSRGVSRCGMIMDQSKVPYFYGIGAVCGVAVSGQYIQYPSCGAGGNHSQLPNP